MTVLLLPRWFSEARRCKTVSFTEHTDAFERLRLQVRSPAEISSLKIASLRTETSHVSTRSMFRLF